MKPIGKYIVITKINEEKKTDSGLILSADDVNAYRYHKAKVIEPGTNVENIKPNDVIFFDKSAGHTMLINNTTYTVITERDVVVVL